MATADRQRVCKVRSRYEFDPSYKEALLKLYTYLANLFFLPLVVDC